MKKLKLAMLGLPALVLALSFATIPVYARNGSDDSTQVSTPQTGTETEQNTSQTPENEAVREAAKQKMEQAREAAKQEFEQKQENSKDKRSDADHQKKCEDRKHGLETKVENINKNAQKHLERINQVYEKALQYQKDQNVTVANFADLTAKADAAKVQAQASVDALNQLKPTLDCTSGTVASDVATFKAAVEQARKDLNAYRSSVKDILKAFETAKEGSDQ